MEGRGLTNLLLAVIAGVLLFGRDAMVTGLKGFGLIAIAIVVLWGLISLALYLLRETLKAFSDAKDWKDVGAVLFVIALACIGLPMLIYAAWLWTQGVPHPVNAAIDSGIGHAWTVVLIFFICGGAVAVLQNAMRWSIKHKRELPGLVKYRVRLLSLGYLEFLGGPVSFPIREWRIRTRAGTKPAIRLISTVYVSLVGLVVATMTALLTILAGVGLWSLF